MTKSIDSADRELNAIGSILNALKGLDGESIQRVLDYVFDRLSIDAPRNFKASGSSAHSHTVSVDSAPPRRISIRDLKEEKKPESSNQMAALVAYYLSEVAEGPDRKDAVNSSDLEKYFKQASFKLPKSLSQTLPNATAAGYFDPSGNGLYTLNAVGYNLVAHGLPRAHASPPKRISKRSGKKTKKSSR